MTYPTSEVPMTSPTAEQQPPTEQPADTLAPARHETVMPDVEMDAPTEPEVAPAAEDAEPDRRDVWDSAQADHYRTDWRELQMQFVDDPSGTTKQAAGLVDEAIQTLTTSLQEHARAIAEHAAGDDNDNTQAQLSALREYRALLNRVLEL